MRHKVHDLKNIDDFNVNLRKDLDRKFEDMHERVDEACDQAEEAVLEAKKAA